MSVINESRQAALLAQMRQMAAAAQVENTGTAEYAEPARFSDMLDKMVDKVNTAQQHSAELSNDFALGESQADLAEVMVAMQKARVHFETMLQVRNRLVSAYEEIMRMPV